MRWFMPATSLSGVESPVSIPVLTSHAMILAEQCAKTAVAKQMVRRSVGIENADLEHALKP
jgi:cystathionine beta-lyase/cystathionine gamma-synthase